MTQMTVETARKAAAIPASRRRRFAPRSRATWLSLLILTVGALIVMVPFYWMISTSLKAQGNLYLYPPQWIPNPIVWENFREVWDAVPFATFTKNTAVIVTLVMIGTLLSCSFSAYGFARLRAPGRDFIFLLVLATMMLPGAVTLVPTYIAFNKLGWINSILPLVVPAFFGAPFYIFMLRQFYLSIPKEIEESGRIDGASSFRIWWDLMLPLTKPALATVAVFTFFATYNDFFGPLIYLNSESKQTIAVGLSYFTGSRNVGPQMHLLMAMTLMATIPSLIVFIFAQRYFVQSIVTTGLKG
ncbi:MAG TPA: carbohydrate ABC transporter permease [Thermomicrobiales bacterium]|nr:carbohydrate ABC transporter permease [Thermomicrobiales bacterium]